MSGISKRLLWPQNWLIEGVLGGGKYWRSELKPIPFVVGRREGCHLHIDSEDVSRKHAEFFFRNDQLWLVDFNSTNGTFVNKKKLTGEIKIRDGDIIHFASNEFRVRNKTGGFGDSDEGESLTQLATVADLSEQFVSCSDEFTAMLEKRAVMPCFQPIVNFSDQRIFGYELLGRGNYSPLPENPSSLFYIAERLGKAVELSELFRYQGGIAARAIPEDCSIFINTHPSENKQARLIGRMEEIRTLLPNHKIIVEINEQAITNIDAMVQLGNELSQLDMGIAYDDFGAGQSRLLELSRMPPDVIKFDISLIRNIHLQTKKIKNMLKTLVKMVTEMNIAPLAEGIEVNDELRECIDMGFQLGQGYYLGKPAKIKGGD